MKKSLRFLVGILVLAIGMSLGTPSVSAAETYSFEPTTLNGTVASLKATVSNITDASAQYAIKVGVVNPSNGCDPDLSFVPAGGISPDAGKTSVSLSYTATVKPGINYCGLIAKTSGGSTNIVFTSLERFSIQATTVMPGDTTATGTPNQYGCVENGTSSYCMLAPIPLIGDSTGKVNFNSCTVNGVTTEGGGFGCYVNGIIKVVIGLVGVFAVIMLIVSGIEIMTTDKPGEKATGKARALNAVFGLILALGSYTILNTINPNLVNLTVTLPKVALSYDAEVDKYSVSDTDYTNFTHKPVLGQGYYIDKATEIANNLGIPPCGLITTLSYESSGRPGAIGADENVQSNSIKSRRAFIASGKKYSGAALPQGASTTSSVKNDDSHKLVNGKLQLDGRFSYGIGLLQVTVFPDAWNSASYTTNPPDWASYKDKQLTANILGTVYTPEQLLDADTNMTVGGKLWQYAYNMCGKDIPGTWRAYATGSCDSTNPFAIAQAQARTATYNECLASVAK